MRLMKLFFFLPVLLAGALALNSCSDKVDVNTVRKSGIVMDGTQEVPAKPGAWSGTLDVEYNKDTRILYYKFTWTGLSGNATAMHIHGPGKRGFSAPIIQTFSAFTAAPAGTFSGSVFFDGVVMKENDLFAGEYYINVHTALNPGGEIRGQIEF
jgi:hypothetical protein